MNEKLDAMNRSLLYWLQVEYRATGLGQDASPSKRMQAELNKLMRRWQGVFDQFSTWLAKSLVERIQSYGDRQLDASLRAKGFKVKFQDTPEVLEAVNASVLQNVQLIRSLSEQQRTQVQGIIMRSVTQGRDLKTLSSELQNQFGVTRRRAEFIARDQNNKATSALQAARQQQLGISRGTWLHSHAGKTPRPSHVEADGKEFDIAKGMFLDGKWTMPGEEPNCRCTWKPIIPGFE